MDLVEMFQHAKENHRNVYRIVVKFGIMKWETLTRPMGYLSEAENVALLLN